MLHNFKRLDKGATALGVFFVLALAGPITALAATTPSLGVATTYAVLGSTYTNTSITTINGDVGFTTPPAIPPLGAHTNYGSGAPYATAGIDQGAALTTLNSQPCDFTFGAATDLSLLSQPLTPGVYCVTGAQSIGTGGITLVSGTYIFRSTGALNTVANSSVVGGSACDVFWTPTATTLGGNSTFLGTDIDPSGITVGAVTNWVGRALSFGGTVTTDTDTITAPTCVGAPPPVLATLHVIKNVVNTNGGTATSSDFMVHVKLSGTDVAGSPTPGTTTPGTPYTLNANTYTVSENAFAGYGATFSGDCNVGGSVTLSSGDNKTCTITNTDIASTTSESTTTPSVHLHVIKVVVNGNGGTAVPSDFLIHVKSATSTLDVLGSPAAGTSTPGTLYTLSAGTYVASENANASYIQSFSGDCDSNGTITLASGDKTCTITNTDIASTTSESTTTPSVHLHVIKLVVNTNGGTATSSDFMVHVKTATSSLDVLGSPAAGTSTPGTLYTLSAGTYVTSENANPSYIQSFSGDCDATGTVTLVSSDKTCTIINTEIAPSTPVTSSRSGGSSGSSSSTTFTSTPTTSTPSGSVLGASTNNVSVPGFPNTGFPPEENRVSWSIVVLAGALVLAVISHLVLKKETI